MHEVAVTFVIESGSELYGPFPDAATAHGWAVQEIGFPFTVHELHGLPELVIADEWERKIMDYVELNDSERVTVVELMERALEIPREERTYKAHRRVVAILRARGWLRNRSTEGMRCWYYAAPDDEKA
jgi:hypothetical protein